MSNDRLKIFGNELNSIKYELFFAKAQNWRRCMYSDSKIEDKSKIFSDIKEDLITTIDFSKNSAMYIGIDLFGIKTINEILENLNDKSMLLLIYQNEQVINELSEVVDFSKCKNQVIIFSGDSEGNLDLNILRTLLGDYIYVYTNMIPIVKKTEVISEIRSYRKILSFIGDFKSNYTFAIGNHVGDTLYGIRNRIINLKETLSKPSFKEFKEKNAQFYKGKPAVVIATGPSLDKNLHELKGYEDNILILSCDASLGALEKQNIMPHIVGSVERRMLTYETFYKNRKFDNDIVYVGPSVVRPEIIEKFPENALALYKDKDTYGKYFNQITGGEKGIIHCGSSVAHLLFEVANQLECNPIILIGQDLAYSETGHSHTKEAKLIEQVELDTVEVWLEDIYGEKIPSTFIWNQFRITYNAMIEASNSVVIDATEGGAKIDGTLIRPFKEVLEEYCNKEVPNFFERFKTMTVPDDNGRFLKSLEGVTYLSTQFTDLLELIQNGKMQNSNALNICTRGIKTQEELDSIYDAIDFVDEEIVLFIRKTSLLLMLFQFPIRDAASKINNLNSSSYTLETIQFNLELHRDLLIVMENSTKSAIKVIMDSLKQVYEINDLKDQLVEINNVYQKYSEWIFDDSYDVDMN